MKKKKKWYDEEYEFTVEVTGFLHGDHTEHYCRNGEEIGDTYTCTYGCPVNKDGFGICSKTMMMLYPLMEAVRSARRMWRSRRRIRRRCRKNYRENTGRNDMELWDAYDRNFNIIPGVTLVRGEEATFADGVYHLVCEIIVKHADGTYLIMQRDPRKTYGSMWEASAGGSALRGESPLDGAIRELKEETGITADRLTEVGRVVNPPTHSVYVDYMAETSCDKDSVVLQEGETVAYRWIDRETLIAMKSELLTHRMWQFVPELQD